MPGAVIVINQPTGAGAGSPGVARRDLWKSKQIQLVVGTSSNSSIEWALVDKPSGSAATLTNADQTTCTFTPDVRGTYRIQLVTNGGGPGNVQILVARVRFTSTGSPDGRQYVLPALGEVEGESNYLVGISTNLRAWAQVFEEIFADVETSINSFGGTLGGDLSGSMPNPTVVAIHGTTVPTTSGTEIGKFLKCSAAGTAIWDVVSQTLAGDVTGSIGTNTVVGLTHVASNLTFSQSADVLIDANSHKILLGTGSGTTSVTVGKTGNTTEVQGSAQIDQNLIVLGQFEIGGAFVLPLPQTLPYQIVAGNHSNTGTGSNTFMTIGTIQFDPTTMASAPSGTTRTFKFVFELWGAAGDTVAMQLFNLTDGEIVTGTTFSSTSTTPQGFVSSALTVGSSAGNLKNSAKIYAVQIAVLVPATAGSGDGVTCGSAKLTATYA